MRVGNSKTIGDYIPHLSSLFNSKAQKQQRLKNINKEWNIRDHNMTQISYTVLCAKGRNGCKNMQVLGKD